MTKRSAETFAEHESVPPGALPFFAPSAKRSRSRGGCGLPSSPSDPFPSDCHAFSSSSDEMSDVSDVAVDQTDAVSAHHLNTAPGCWPLPQGHVPQCAQQLSFLGILSAPACPDSRLFLEQLAACMYRCQLAGSTSTVFDTSMAASIGTSMWHAFAELNVVLSRHFSELPTSMLRGYHSFTRAPRAQLWGRFAASQGGQLAEASPLGWPSYLVLTRFLLEHVLAAYPSASSVLYTIEVPPWLRSWCARWGQAQHHPHAHGHGLGEHGRGPVLPGGVLRILAVFAYEESGVASARGQAAPPRVLYVPFGP